METDQFGVSTGPVETLNWSAAEPDPACNASPKERAACIKVTVCSLEGLSWAAPLTRARLSWRTCWTAGSCKAEFEAGLACPTSLEIRLSTVPDKVRRVWASKG